MNLNNLNPQQRKAVVTARGPLLVLAGAGTGKTRVITYRIAHLISTGVDPSRILAVTFTNKAAREMKERVARLLSRDAAAATTVGTFHSFCARLLRQRIRSLGYGSDFVIAGEAYQAGLVRTLMAELGCTGEGRDARAWLSVISKAKCAFRTPADLRGEERRPFADEIAAVYELYQRRMRQMNLVDFDDLLILVIELWENDPEALAEHRERYEYLLIDEYQDTNYVQFRLMSTLAGSRGNICVVGDDDQSIYGWRGADVGNILQFESQFARATVVQLEQNYRSTNTILEAANSLISHNPNRHEKKLWSDSGAGEDILAVSADDADDEARFVAEYLRDRYPRHGSDYGSFAVLFRSNHQSRTLENHLRQAQIPYTIVGTRSFYERKEILDTVSLLQAAQNPKDDLSFLRILNVPPRGVGDSSIARLKEWQRITALPLQQLIAEEDLLAELPAAAAANLRQFAACLGKYRRELSEPTELARKITGMLEESGYIEGLGRMYKPREDAIRRRDNVLEFINEVAEFEAREGVAASLRAFLERLALLDASDLEESRSAKQEGSVTLMTVHAAKGLEFPVVIVVGLERGLFPHQRSLEEHGEHEERRLFYVALTRARQEVVLLYAAKRRVKGQVMRRRRSSFIDELPEDLVCFRTSADALTPLSSIEASDYLTQMKAMFAPQEDG